MNATVCNRRAACSRKPSGTHAGYNLAAHHAIRRWSGRHRRRPSRLRAVLPTAQSASVDLDSHPGIRQQ